MTPQDVFLISLTGNVCGWVLVNILIIVVFTVLIRRAPYEEEEQ